jgi:prevent-host-death family protein
MIAVGVRDLKNQLSQYLQYVKDSEKVVITEHNKVIAEITSPSKEVTNTDVEIELEKLAATGKLVKAKRNKALQHFDSSILLAIILDEKRKDEALKLWNGASIRVSSILLKLETITVLRRTFEHNKTKLESNWITKKITALHEYLKEVNFRIIDEDIEKIIALKKEISKCKTLDAIHIATALEFSSLIPTSDFYLYTFDKNMSELAKSCKFKVNTLEEENCI